MNVAQAIAQCLFGMEHNSKAADSDLVALWQYRLEFLATECLPSGSGFDNGTELDLERSNPQRLVFKTSFHHMTEGSYDGWTEHSVTVRPSFLFGREIAVSGRNRNQIKDYIAETFESAMAAPAPDGWMQLG